MLDIDHFKSINDMFGHQVGDEILMDIGAILKDTKRKSDVPGSYGGEEFIIMLPDSESNGALIVAERFRQNVEDYPFEDGEGNRLFVTVSIGVATYPSDEISSSADLIKKADDALYEAKESGRNKVIVSKEGGI